MRLRIKHVESLLDRWPKRKVNVVGGGKPPLVIASDALADPGITTEGFIIVDVIDGAKRDALPPSPRRLGWFEFVLFSPSPQ